MPRWTVAAALNCRPRACTMSLNQPCTNFEVYIVCSKYEERAQACILQGHFYRGPKPNSCLHGPTHTGIHTHQTQVGPLSHTFTHSIHVVTAGSLSSFQNFDPLPHHQAEHVVRVALRETTIVSDVVWRHKRHDAPKIAPLKHQGSSEAALLETCV